MFDKVLINYPTDIGQIAESLLFYDQVNILVNEATLNNLFSQVDSNTLVSFIHEHREKINISYYQSHIAVHTRATQDNFDMRVMFEDEVDNVPYVRYLRKHRVLPGQNGTLIDKKITDQFVDMLQLKFTEQKDLDNIVRELNTENYFNKYCISYLKDNGYKIDESNFYCRLIEERNGSFSIDSSFKEGIIVGTRSSKCDLRNLAYSYATEIMSLINASKYDSDIMNIKEASDIVGLRMRSLVNKFPTADRDIELFQNIVLSGGHSIREVINSGERSFMEFVGLYEKSTQFKKWLSECPADSNVIEAYYKETFSGSWLEKLPIKIMKWILFNGAGLTIDTMGGGGIGTTVGLGISFIDAFLLDKMVRGWKPNQFIDNKLKLFVNQ